MVSDVHPKTEAPYLFIIIIHFTRGMAEANYTHRASPGSAPSYLKKEESEREKDIRRSQHKMLKTNIHYVQKYLLNCDVWLKMGEMCVLLASNLFICEIHSSLMYISQTTLKNHSPTS